MLFSSLVLFLAQVPHAVYNPFTRRWYLRPPPLPSLPPSPPAVLPRPPRDFGESAFITDSWESLSTPSIAKQEDINIKQEAIDIKPGGQVLKSEPKDIKMEDLESVPALSAVKLEDSETKPTISRIKHESL